MRNGSGLLVAALFLAVLHGSGCSGGDSSQGSVGDEEFLSELMDSAAYRRACAEVPGCSEPRFEPAEGAEIIWRVLVVRSASGQVRIERVEAVAVPKDDGVPVGPLAGNYALIGLDAQGRPVDGQPIRFPETMRIEYAGGVLPVDLIDISAREVDAVAYVRALESMHAITVQDESGSVVASVPAPSIRNAGLGRKPPQAVDFVLFTPLMANRRPWSGLPPHCSHVILLQGEADRHLAAGVVWEELAELVRPGPWQVATAQGALARMTPLLCQSIGRIAFGRVPSKKSSGAVSSVGVGDMMIINVSAGYEEEELAGKLSQQLYMQQTLTHEAGHTAETLLTAEGLRAGTYGGAWGLPPRTLAQKTIDRVRLAKGLQDEWLRIHESFVEQGWAVRYPSQLLLDDPKERQEWPAQKVVEGGFMSRYGSQSWWDDIAEFVAHPYIGPLLAAGIREGGYSESLRLDIACMQMQNHGEKNLPARFAAAYTKLLFLRDLGLVRPEDVQTCTGPKLGLPIDEKGFHFWQGTMQLSKFLNEVEAAIGTKEGGKRVFDLSGAGEARFGDRSFPASLKLRLDLGGRFDTLDEVSWPRGIYPLGLFGDNNLLLRLDGAPAGNFNGKDGFVLVAEASNDRIAGSIFLTQAFRLHAPIPVPQVFDPPLNIRFLIEN